MYDEKDYGMLERYNVLELLYLQNIGQILQLFFRFQGVDYKLLRI